MGLVMLGYTGFTRQHLNISPTFISGPKRQIKAPANENKDCQCLFMNCKLN